MQGIYKIHCNKTAKKYIGSSMDINQRFYSHAKGLKSGNHPNLRLQEDWNRFGEERFDFSVIENMPGAELAEVVKAEQQYLDDEIQWGHDYNIAKIAVNSGESSFKPAEMTLLGEAGHYERALEVENKKLKEKIKALTINEGDKDFWIAIRQAHLMEVDAIERKFNLSPRTSEARKYWKETKR